MQNWRFAWLAPSWSATRRREREMEAKASERRAWDAYGAVVAGDKEKMLDTLTIIGIPARDLADIYEIEQVWRQEGGDASLLEWWRSARAAGRASLGSSSGGETDGD